MSRTHIPAELRERVRTRAYRTCEYCLLHEDDVLHGFQVDHVISEKHNGPTEDHNLAFCCPFCNRAKGSDVAGYADGALVRLYNPRIDHWSDHFELNSAYITARSAIGIVTLQLLGFNDPHRVAIRQELMAARLFPSDEARHHMQAEESPQNDDPNGNDQATETT